MDKKNKSLPDHVLMAGVMLIVALSHLASVKNHLVADTWVFVYPHTFFETLGYFFTSIISPEWEAYWLRPIPMLFFWLDSVIWPGTEWGPHLTNVLLHIINTGLVWTLTRFICTQSSNSRSWIDPRLPAVSASLVYGLHPLNVGAVSWVASRFDVMSVTFGLAGLYLWLRCDAGKGTTKHLIGSAVLLFLSILSKEQGITFLMVCMLINIVRAFSAGKLRKNYWNGIAFLALLTVAYIIYRFSIFLGPGGYVGFSQGLSILPPLAFFTAILFPYTNIFPGWSISSFYLLASVCLIGFAGYLWQRGHKSYGRWERRYLLCAAALFTAGLITTAPHFGMKFSDIMGHAESRFALIALSGFSLLIGYGVTLLIRGQRGYHATLILLLVWSISAAGRTDVQIQAWNDAGITANQIITTTLAEAPDPPANSTLLFFEIPRSNDQFAYIFGIGLKEAILQHYPGRNDIVINPRATGSDLNRVKPDRDFVFGFNRRVGKLERLTPKQ